MTFVWFAIWLSRTSSEGNEPLALDPVNGWTATLILAIALDVNRPSDFGRGLGSSSTK